MRDARLIIRTRLRRLVGINRHTLILAVGAKGVPIWVTNPLSDSYFGCLCRLKRHFFKARRLPALAAYLNCQNERARIEASRFSGRFASTRRCSSPRPDAFMPSVVADARKRAGTIVRLLKREYPEAECALVHETPFQLLIATILSAQCTDERVNIVTKDLFRKYSTPAAMGAIPIKQLEKLIQSTGFFRNKAKSINACCRMLVEEHGGEVPQNLELLVKLPGVGRKTANVVLGTAFRIPSGVVVDTHVTRLSQRLGLTQHEDAVKIERDLIDLLPKKEWIDFSHRLIWHGRRICKARRPLCPECVLNQVCPKIGVDEIGGLKQPLKVNS